MGSYGNRFVQNAGYQNKFLSEFCELAYWMSNIKGYWMHAILDVPVPLFIDR